jgi:hypothetical protein
MGVAMSQRSLPKCGPHGYAHPGSLTAAHWIAVGSSTINPVLAVSQRLMPEHSHARAGHSGYVRGKPEANPRV